MKQGSLEYAIAGMVRRLDAVRPGSGGKSNDPLRDLAAVMPADPVLSALHKEYLEANGLHKELAKEKGLQDPMREVAADALDSARSAMQTRLIELQDEREQETREAMERRLRTCRAKEEAAQARKLIEKRKKDSNGDLVFWLIMMYWLMNRTIFAARRRLSAASDFALVSAGRNRRLYAG